MKLTLERLKERLDYDPVTGVFTWKVTANTSTFAGDRAGSVNDDGYRWIGIDEEIHKASKLAWFWMTGEAPAAIVDHRNGNRDDDRWENLRAATRSQNGANMARRKDNTTGFKGVGRLRDKFQANITHQGHRLWLGVFDSPQEAAAIRNWAAEMLHGEFARAA